MTPSLTHCQNCVCVVQNSLRLRQTTSAVFFFFFFFFLVFIRCYSPTLYTFAIACVTSIRKLEETHAVPRREASMRGSIRFFCQETNSSAPKSVSLLMATSVPKALLGWLRRWRSAEPPRRRQFYCRYLARMDRFVRGMMSWISSANSFQPNTQGYDCFHSNRL